MPSMDDVMKANPLAALLLGALASKMGDRPPGDSPFPGMPRGGEAVFDGRGSSLGDALRDALEKAGKSSRSVEDEVESLRLAAERYGRPCPFTAAQLVTPRKDSADDEAGRPHIVLEVAPTPIRNWAVAAPKETGSAHYGRKVDMRVATTCGCPHGEIRAFWVENWEYEPWTAPAAASAEEAAPQPDLATA